MSEQVTKVDDGGPTFPMPVIGTPEDARLDECVPGHRPELMGMTLRDYLAAQALAGILPSCDGSTEREGVAWNASHYAKVAYLVADAMLKARKS